MGNDFKSNYTKMQLLGSGGFGEVYLYRHNKSNQYYAVLISKLIYLEADRFKNMIEIYKNLPKHPNII